MSFAATRPAAFPPESDRGKAEPPLDTTAYATWGLALTLLSLPGGSAWVRVLGVAGTCIAAAAGVRSRFPAGPLGIAGSLPEARGTATHLATVLLVAPPIGALASCISDRVDRVVGVRTALDGSFGIGTAILCLGATIAVYVARVRSHHLVLGARERARGALGSALAITGVALAVLLTRVVAPLAVFQVGAAVAAVLASVAASFRDAILLAQIGRRALALLLFGGPVVLLSALAAEGFGSAGPTAALVGGAVALGVGTLGSWLERPFRPAEGRWLDAFVAARAELARADPESSLQRALVALRAAGGMSTDSPELWSMDPASVTTIDAAGYVRERPASLPPLLVETAASEPEATVRKELLDVLLVRRPDLRPLARWMDEHGALAATLVTRDGQAGGVLVVPRGARREEVTLEEAHALKELADAMSGVCAGRSALARSWLREREATARAETAEHEVDRRRHADGLAATRLALGASGHVQGAHVGRYSPAMRLARSALCRRIHVGAPVFVVAPIGLDPVPYLAEAHLSGPHRGAPFVVVDCTASLEHDMVRWRDPAVSPLALAQGGLLVLADSTALPIEVQKLIAKSLAERRAPWNLADPLEVAIALTSVQAVAELEGRLPLDPALRARLGNGSESLVALPALRNRSEDLRALFLDRLAREGLRQSGVPVGIDDAAFALLVDYTFPGDYDELVLVARRLSARAEGGVVRAADVCALELKATETRERPNGPRTRGAK